MKNKVAADILFDGAFALAAYWVGTGGKVPMWRQVFFAGLAAGAVYELLVAKPLILRGRP